MGLKNVKKVIRLASQQKNQSRLGEKYLSWRRNNPAFPGRFWVERKIAGISWVKLHILPPHQNVRIKRSLLLIKLMRELILTRCGLSLPRQLRELNVALFSLHNIYLQRLESELKSYNIWQHIRTWFVFLFFVLCS